MLLARTVLRGSHGNLCESGESVFWGGHPFKIYVDKTKLISYTDSVISINRKNLCMGRPRRVGKSMAADMLVAYYEIRKRCAVRDRAAYKEVSTVSNRHFFTGDKKCFYQKKYVISLQRRTMWSIRWACPGPRYFCMVTKC